MADDLQKLTVSLEARFTQFDRAVARSLAATERSMARMEARTVKASRGMEQALAGAASRMAAPLAGLGASLSAAAVVGYADAWTNAGNRLAAVGVPLDQVASKQNELVQIALRSRTELGAVVDIYAKMAASAGTLGASQAEVARVTETVAKALVLGGASAQEAAATIRQLGQALGSGVLRGDEFNSVLEQSAPLAQLIAKEFGVTTSELRAMAEAGELVGGRVFRGLLKGSADIDRSVASMSLTVAQAAENFQTALTAYIGNADQATGVTRTLAAAIQFMAENFDLLESAAVLTGAALAGRLVSGLAAAGAGMSATALAARGLTGALALIGGPVGLAVTAAGGLLYLASQHDSAKVATEAHNDALRLLREQVAGAAGRSRDYIDALAKEKEAQLQAAEADLQRAEALASVERAKAIERRQRGGFSMGLSSGDATPGQSVGAIAGAMINPDAFLSDDTLTKLEQGRERIAAIRTAIEDLRSLAAGGGGAGTGTGTGGGRGSEVDSVKQVVDALAFEKEQLGRTTIEQRLYNELKRAGVALNSEHGEQIRSLVNEIETERAALDDAKAAQERLNEAAKAFETSVVDALGNVILGTEDAADAFKKLAIEMAKSALTGQGAFAGLFGGGSGTSGGGLLNPLGALCGFG